MSVEITRWVNNGGQVESQEWSLIDGTNTTVTENAGAKTIKIDASGGAGTVTSVALSVPTGLSISGSPITSSGTLAISLTSGYAIPTAAKQTEWDSAFGWGNHVSAGYLTSASIDTLSELNAIVGVTLIESTNAALTDARTPLSHTHGNITNAGAIGSTSGLPIKTGTSGVLEVGAFGTGSAQFCEGNDSRLSDARTPTAHAASHVNGTDDIQSATAAQKGLMTATAMSKLDSIAASANNYTHPNHSGDVTSSGDGAQTIANGVVTLAKMLQNAAGGIDGNAAIWLETPSGTNLSTALAGSPLTVAGGGTGLTSLGTALQIIRVNAGATALEFATLSGGGDAVVSGTLDQFADVTQTGGATLAITSSATLGGGNHSGTNTGDNAVNSLYSGLVSNATHTGDATGATALTLATVNSNVGSFGSATAAGTFTVNGKGLITAAGSTTITPAVGSITGLGTGIGAALAINTGSAGAPVLFNGAGGTPSSITLTNATGTAASLTAGTASAVAVGGITGLGTGVGTALAVNVGSAGAFVTYNGNAGTPSAIVLTNATGTAASLTAGTASAVAVGGITGLGTGVATALAINVGSAGAPVVLNGAGGTPSSITLTNATGYSASNLASGTLPAARLGADSIDAITEIAAAIKSGTGTKLLTDAVDANLPIYTEKHSASHTISAAECYGGVHYVTSAATITLPAVAAGMSVTIITVGAIAVSVDPNASDKLYLDGVALDDGDKATNLSTSGDIIVLTYYDATGWYAASNGWTDTGA